MSMERAPKDRRILIFVPRESVRGPWHRHATNNPLYQGWHTARWEGNNTDQWIVGGEVYMDEAFHIDADMPTHWQEVPEDPA